MRKTRLFALIMAIAVIGTMFCTTVFATADAAVETIGAIESSVVTFDVDGEAVEYDLADGDSAHAYVDSYADNLTNDPGFKAHIETALAKVRESIGAYATFAALLAPVIAIVLALITKEVYSSLIIGIVVGGFIYAGGNFETAINHVLFNLCPSISCGHGFSYIKMQMYPVSRICGTVLNPIPLLFATNSFVRSIWRATTHPKHIPTFYFCAFFKRYRIFEMYISCPRMGIVLKIVLENNSVTHRRIINKNIHYRAIGTSKDVSVLMPGIEADV